jgi:hypothetical protein
VNSLQEHPAPEAAPPARVTRPSCPAPGVVDQRRTPKLIGARLRIKGNTPSAGRVG